MEKFFIKVVNPDEAEKLAKIGGFQYIKENNVFVFPYSEELMKLLNKEYSSVKYFCENKLRF